MTLQDIVKILMTSKGIKSITLNLGKVDKALNSDPDLLVKLIHSRDSLHSMFHIRIDILFAQSGSLVDLKTYFSAHAKSTELELPVPVLLKLVPLGVDINLRNKWGGTALHICSRKGWVPQAAQLLRAGADLNAVDNDGVIPESLAIDEKMQKLFISAKKGEL